MNHYIETSKKNLLPFSHASIFTEALGEWAWTFDFIDYGEAVETCHLCEHESLRYHFKIANAITQHILWVGSSCITKFKEIRVYAEDGTLLTGNARGEALKKRIERNRLDRMKQELDALWMKLQMLPKRSKGTVSKNVFERLQRCIYAASQEGYEGFTPYEVIGLFRNMQQLQIPYNPGVYKLNLRHHQAKIELQAVRDMERCLSLEQRKRHEFDFTVDEIQTQPEEEAEYES